MAAAVWLWTAPPWSGVCEEEGTARAEALALLRSGAADRAVVEEAELGVSPALEPCYGRTGRAWRATAAGWRACPPLAA